MLQKKFLAVVGFKDDEVIAAANEHNIAMMFTGMRHFRH